MVERLRKELNISRSSCGIKLVRHTCSEPSLVNPRMHVCALVLELLELVVCVLNFHLEIFDLVLVWSDRIIERLGQWIWCRLYACCDGTMGSGTRGYGASRCRIISLVASSGGSVRLKLVLRVESTGVLSILEGRTLMIVDVVCDVVGEGSGRHW